MKYRYVAIVIVAALVGLAVIAAMINPRPTPHALVFESLVQDIGPVTTRTDFSSIDVCLQEMRKRIMATGDRMMRAHCEQK